MKLRQFIFIIFLILLGLQFVIGQEKPKAKLIVELGLTNCCDLDAHIHYFQEEFRNNINQTAYVIIYSDNRNLRQAFGYERLILGSIKNANFDESRLNIVRKITNGSLKVALWKVETGESLPFSTENEWDISSLSYLKPTLFFSSKNDDGVCYAWGENKQFAEILSANQGLTGNIVIFEQSQKGFNKAKTELLNEISRKYNISQNQLKIFFFKVKNDSYPYHELWLIPKKKHH